MHTWHCTSAIFRARTTQRQCLVASNLGQKYLFSDHWMEQPDRIDPSPSPCWVQMSFIWNSQHVGGVVLPLQLLASTDNMVDDIPYFPACPKFAEKYRNKHKTWAERLFNTSHSWDSTWIECTGPSKACEPYPQPFHPAIWKQILLSEVWCNRTSPLNGSGSEDSKGMQHLVQIYVAARPRPYLVEA